MFRTRAEANQAMLRLLVLGGMETELHQVRTVYDNGDKVDKFEGYKSKGKRCFESSEDVEEYLKICTR